MMKEVVERINVESETSSRNYVVCRYDDGSYSCNCASWIFHKGQKVDCKHIEKLKRQEQQERTLYIDGLKVIVNGEVIVNGN